MDNITIIIINISRNMYYHDKGGSTFLWYPHTALHSTTSKTVKIFISKAVGISILQVHINLEAFLMQQRA